VIFKAGRWRGKTRWKGTRSGTRFRLLGVIAEIGGWRGQLVGQLVTVLIFVRVGRYVVLFCVLRQKFGGLQTVPPFATGQIYCKPAIRIAEMLHLYSVLRKNWPVLQFANRAKRLRTGCPVCKLAVRFANGCGTPAGRNRYVDGGSVLITVAQSDFLYGNLFISGNLFIYFTSVLTQLGRHSDSSAYKTPHLEPPLIIDLRQ